MKRHKTAERVEQRTVVTRICVQAGCRFKGESQVQGVCHSNTGELADFVKLDKQDAELCAELKEMQKREGKDYVRALEAYYVTAMMNWSLMGDELIRLRRDNSILKDQVAKKSRK